MNVCLSTRARRGFSLVEVLVAVLIFSLGLLGLAGLLVMSTQSSYVSYLRTQVGFMAEQMANHMRANPQGVWAGSYDSAAYPIAGVPPVCDNAAGCSPLQVAQRDQILWSRQLQQFLPAGASAAVQCTQPGAGPAVSATQFAYRPPYAGTCSMTVTWTETTLARGGMPAAQTFAWVFQP
ncbi:type IV pilus modification protein PilV [Metallibacterium sp.]|uniref:type IV pilus modification protein PilV n=1 Tax=Metallibacterium sp. TaxID=2940281 RepID=UPI0026132544|nr:type IV pilus modification protein PilV [Metallibacterium sp.]